MLHYSDSTCDSNWAHVAKYGDGASTCGGHGGAWYNYVYSYFLFHIFAFDF